MRPAALDRLRCACGSTLKSWRVSNSAAFEILVRAIGSCGPPAISLRFPPRASGPSSAPPPRPMPQ
jgi:hypothetical protein